MPSVVCSIKFLRAGSVVLFLSYVVLFSREYCPARLGLCSEIAVSYELNK
jgi:hypothetical protein